MLKRISRIMTVIMLLFLPQLSLKAMEMEWDQKKSPQLNEKGIERTTYLKINKHLKLVVHILEANLGLDTNHKIISIEDKMEKVQCKLSVFSCPLISGKANKPLRDDLRTLLYKPWTDVYYGEYLSKKDFTLLKILRDAIVTQPALNDQNTIRLSLNAILAFKQPDNFRKNNVKYPDIFFRRSLDEINRLLKRCNVEANDTVQMTLTKTYMLHVINPQDKKNINLLEDELFLGKAKNAIDTYSKRRFKELFKKIKTTFSGMNPDVFSSQNQILHSLNAGDIVWLNGYEQNILQVKDILLPHLIEDLKTQLATILNRTDYLKYFTLYRDHPLLQNQHNSILNEAQNQGNINEVTLTDLFVELSQLKISLNSLGNGRDRGSTAFVQGWDIASNGSSIDWMGVPERVAKVKETIAVLQSKLLQELNAKKEICAEKIIAQMQLNQKEKEEKIKQELQKKEIWILAMDGGGVRGKIAAEILRDLIHQLKLKGHNKDLSNMFDIVAGTSVGGLIALAINLPDENGRAALDENYIATLLETEKASIIFPPKSGFNKILGQANSNAYDPMPLENLLLGNFGHTPLSDMRKSTTVIAHSKVTEKPVAFNSCVGSTNEMTIAGCARSTSAAPTYFPPNVQCFNGKIQEFVDGGMTENNPVYEALRDLDYLAGQNRDWKDTKINILSIGTGVYEESTPHGRAKTGVNGVAHTLLNGTMPKGISDAHEKTVLHLGGLMQSGAVVSYYRLNPELDIPIELDSASEENLAKLRTLVYESILSSPFYAQLIEHLRGERNIIKSQYVEIASKSADQREEFMKCPPYLSSMRRGNK